MVAALWKPMAVVALGATMMTASIQDAEASRRGRIATGVAIGVIAGVAVAGAIASSRRARAETVIIDRGPDCGEYRRQARYNERIGRFGRAEEYWALYRDCTGH